MSNVECELQITLLFMVLIIIFHRLTFLAESKQRPSWEHSNYCHLQGQPQSSRLTADCLQTQSIIPDTYRAPSCRPDQSLFITTTEEKTKNFPRNANDRLSVPVVAKSQTNRVHSHDRVEDKGTTNSLLLIHCLTSVDRLVDIWHN